MRVWIDNSNSPHPLLFAPVARRLERDGHEVLVTARDNAQTVELAQQRWPVVDVIGGPSPESKTAKARSICGRVADLRCWASGRKPDVALSHNSYAQIAAARMLNIPAVTAMDFEGQPANHVAFRLATVVLVPEVLPARALRWQGARSGKVIRYAGLKEELYLGDFRPDRHILERIGLSPRPKVVVVMRTPPTRAIYHPSRNPLFEDTVRTVCAQQEVGCVVLARHPEQVKALEGMRLNNCVVPRIAIDSRSLMYACDLVVGGGGTMTREAALMGVPTWTMFAGVRPAVDVWLEQQGMLMRLKDPRQLSGLAPRQREPRSPVELQKRGAGLEELIVQSAVEACQ